MQGHINAYYSFKDMEKIRDKRELYKRINRETRDNITIVAFVSRNAEGELLSESTDDDYYHDVFILEGLSSSTADGVFEELPDDPDASDFWILNTNLHPAILGSRNNCTAPINIEGQSLQLIKCSHMADYAKGDIYLEHNGISRDFIPVGR
jgi:hypothetical protein